MPEAGVEQMSCDVFHTAVIPVDRHPVFHFVIIGQCLVIFVVKIAQEVPAGARPLRHGVCFALGRAAAVRTGSIDPFRDAGQRRLAGVGRFIALDLWQL